jgi:hydrogenase maturation protease
VTLFLAIGNPLRGDDGVAQAVLDQLEAHERVVMRSLHQLAPEVAEEIAAYATVVFLDADQSAGEVILETVDERPTRRSLTHISSPGEIVVLARALFGFTGEALLCRIPATDFAPQHCLSRQAQAAAAIAAQRLAADFLSPPPE